MIINLSVFPVNVSHMFTSERVSLLRRLEVKNFNIRSYGFNL